MPRPTPKRTAAPKLKNPKGGLTQAGRDHFAKTEGAHLKPGVRAAPKTPTEMRRKGSFLTRFYGRAKPHPLHDDKGNPSRYALAAHAWGEPVPKTLTAVRKLAKIGEALLKRAAAAKAKTTKKSAKKAPKTTKTKSTKK